MNQLEGFKEVTLRDLEPEMIVKVSLPGETPWAIVVSVDANHSSFVGKIDNKLYAEKSEEERSKITRHMFGESEPLPSLHDYKYGDELTFIEQSGIFVPLEGAVKQ